MALVEIRGLTKRFRKGDETITPLDNVDLDIDAGEFVVLMGPSGTGKSTLLKSVLMLVTPAAGSVRIFGEAHDSARARAQLAYLPQRFSPPGHLSGLPDNASRPGPVPETSGDGFFYALNHQT